MRAEIDDFLRYCRIERRLAPLTCSAYERDVTACVRFLTDRGFSDLRDVRPPDLRAFLATEPEHRPALPALVLRTPKKREALPDILDRRELTRLLAATERVDVWKRNFTGKRERDRLLLALFAYAGLRRSRTARPRLG